MRRAAGLTLVETLAATALIALLAATVAGFCVDLARVPRVNHQVPNDGAQGRAVDEIMAEPEFMRATTVAADPAPARAVFHGLELKVSRTVAQDGSHAWLVFETGGHATVRWIRLAPPADGDRR